MLPFITEYPQFFTATNLEWKRLLKPDKYKNIIVESLRHLVNAGKIKVFAFVIMDNHLHLIWQMMVGIPPASVQRDFMKYTAQQIKNDLIKHHPGVLPFFKVNSKDRTYQFWERNALSIELRSDDVFVQKLNYIHNNPIKAGITSVAEDYKYSSARFYATGVNDWGFLTHFRD
ncbi:MAG: transposase [Chitinophagaceae bacterium]